MIHFELKPRDLSMVTEAGDPMIAAGKYVATVGGGQPDTGAPAVQGSIEVAGQMKLPE